MRATNPRRNGDANGHTNGSPTNGSLTNGSPRNDLPVTNGRADSLPHAKNVNHALVTGGAGFIGTNVASRLLSRGADVTVYDNLSRPGVERNLDWLRAEYGRKVRFVEADVRDRDALARAVRGADRVFHFAAQVAVTTSLDDPRADFEVNALGTLNVLEACRALDDPPPLLFTSTNKVYGDLGGLELRCDGERYEPADEEIRRRGVSEAQCLDFHSPYGCSKGTADQYVLDHARCYGLPAVVFRMSCIYGPHQCGTEDQGWVAHFAREVLAGRGITFYGDGRQVRDLLFVEDLVDAMLLATDQTERTAGRAFNMGGGPANAVSLREVIAALMSITGRRPRVRYDEWRQGDQRYYVSDTRAFARVTGWSPKVGVREGIDRLCRWLAAHAPRAAQPVLT
jgi:CDP-paratose 2-epimerase